MTKEEVRLEIIKFLWDGNDILTWDSIFKHFEKIIKQKKELKPLEKPLKTQDIQLINEVIWDLIVERMITPIKNPYDNNYNRIDITDKFEKYAKELFSN